MMIEAGSVVAYAGAGVARNTSPLIRTVLWSMIASLMTVPIFVLAAQLPKLAVSDGSEFVHLLAAARLPMKPFGRFSVIDLIDSSLRWLSIVMRRSGCALARVVLVWKVIDGLNTPEAFEDIVRPVKTPTAINARSAIRAPRLARP